MATVVAARRRVRALRPGETAWIALLPCALLTFLTVMALGPPLGHALFEPPSGEALWPPGLPSTAGDADPVKRGRFAVMLLGPALLAASVLLGARRPLRLAPSVVRALVGAGQLTLLAFLAAAVLGQNDLLVHHEAEDLSPIFGVPTLVIAALLALVLAAALRTRAVVTWVARRLPETRRLRIACLVLATVLVAAWLLTAITTERAVDDTGLNWWTMDDPFAILNGRTPLVDFHAFYAQLTPYVGAGALALFGPTVLTYSIAMASLSLLALLAVYGVLHRIVGSSALALALFVPFVAIGFLAIAEVSGGHRLTNALLFAIWPMRYGGAYVVAWLVARHVDGVAPRRTWLLMLAAGVVAMDNLEFGAAAFAATFVALLSVRRDWTRSALARLAGNAVVGLTGAAVLVSAITLVRAGALPSLDYLLEFPRVFGILGLVSLPMPVLGFHLVLLATYVAAIAVAAVRRADGEPQALLTGMLAWSGVFGLLSGSYYLGRSDSWKLVALFSAWGFALVLLTIVVARRLASAEGRRPGVGELAVLLGLGLAICSLRELPLPWTQIDRIRSDRPSLPKQPVAVSYAGAKRFVAAHSERGERVTILIPQGHRIAEELGLVGVSPYPLHEAIVTRRQWDGMVAATRREGAHTIFLPVINIAPEHYDALRQAGYAPLGEEASFSAWSDA